ncbi:LacI family transcriptional regulator [Plantibacter flavus]|uniref:LacI family DNA-binding transcriptional regulator n=1 Tax=Plantibacter flavus TaxID=150123 RepID=UPI003F143711
MSIADEGTTLPRAASAGRMPTMKDIAEHVGVSRQLVSLVVRNVAGPSAESRDRILQAAAELGYRPNTSARLLRQRRTRLIGVGFVMESPFQVSFVERLFARAAREGFALALGPVTPERSTDVVIAELMEERVEALIVFNPERDSPVLAEARDLLPVAVLGEWMDCPDADNIHVDEAAGLRQAVQHLVELGHADIAYAGGLGGSLGIDRAEAYRAAMGEAGLADHVDVVEVGFTEEDGATAARSLLRRDRLPTAVVCGGDQCAVGLLTVVRSRGVGVPETISVVGFDDSTVAALSYNQLTSVHQDVDATIDATWDTLTTRIEGDTAGRRVVATPTSLTIRTTTGPAASR